MSVACNYCRSMVAAIPPAAPQRLEQGGRVCVAIGLSLGEIQHGLLICLLSIEQCQVTHRPQLDVVTYGHQAFLSDPFGANTGIECARVELKGAERVCDVLERRQHRGAVLGAGLVEGGSGRALLMKQRATR